MTTTIKIIGGALFISIGVLIFIKTVKNKDKSSDVNNLYEKTLNTQAYVFSLVLIATGIGLIISCFNE